MIQDTSLPKTDEIKAANKIITRRKNEQLTNKSSKTEANLNPDKKKSGHSSERKGCF